MTEIESIFVVLGALFIFEAFVWVRPGTVLMRSHGFGAFRVVSLSPHGALRRRDAGALAAHLSPAGESFLAQGWPVSISRDGVLAWNAEALSDERPTSTGRYVDFADIRRVDHQGSLLCVNGAPFVYAATPRQAAALAEFVARIASKPPRRREALIDRALRASLDAGAVRKRLDEARGATILARSAGMTLFVWFFVVGPLIGVPFVRWLIAVPFLLVFAASGSWIASKKLSPGDARRQWLRSAALLVLPADAVHAGDVASRDVLSTWHPLAVASVLCRRDEFQAFASRALRDARHPRLPGCPSAELKALETARWFRERWLVALDEFFAATGMKPAGLVLPPEPEDATCTAYCPRCLRQSRATGNSCDACGGLEMVGLAGATRVPP